jgi:hypothetical protein
VGWGERGRRGVEGIGVGMWACEAVACSERPGYCGGGEGKADDYATAGWYQSARLTRSPMLDQDGLDSATNTRWHPLRPPSCDVCTSSLRHLSDILASSLCFSFASDEQASMRMPSSSTTFFGAWRAHGTCSLDSGDASIHSGRLRLSRTVATNALLPPVPNPHSTDETPVPATDSVDNFKDKPIKHRLRPFRWPCPQRQISTPKTRTRVP